MPQTHRRERRVSLVSSIKKTLYPCTEQHTSIQNEGNTFKQEKLLRDITGAHSLMLIKGWSLF